jgi:putative redox protein
MPTIRSKYLGDLRTEAIHLASAQKFITDAPLDNQGKGEAFSPTDTVCAALGACMLTIMGIASRTHGIKLEGTQVEITKSMAPNPRRISKIEVRFYDLPQHLDTHKQEILERSARTCPVALSLNPDIEQNVSFEWI